MNGLKQQQRDGTRDCMEAKGNIKENILKGICLNTLKCLLAKHLLVTSRNGKVFYSIVLESVNLNILR